MDVSDASDSRLAQLTDWVREDLGFADSSIVPASVDASFRRYFRVHSGSDSYIVMDAPPEKENSAPFLKVARLLAGMDLNVPIVLARDMNRGFLLLSDLGFRQYLEELPKEGAADKLYADALKCLKIMQTADAQVSRELPRYDHPMLMREMQLMPEWFLRHHLRLEADAAELSMLQDVFVKLAHAAALQPAAFVHRDYHSRNLLVTMQDNPGILDFQDAVWGPVTYDLASLLKDCYISWPPSRVRTWVLAHREQLLESGMPVGKDAAEFLRWFDLMGLQRHIKVLGIFARLYYRDGKSQYLHDLPRVLDYARETAAAYSETAPLADFITQRIDLKFSEAQQRVLTQLRA
jgi:hypothetical protein